MKHMLLLIVALLCNISTAQKIDTIIKTKAYTSFISNEIHGSKYVMYRLLKNSNRYDCKRESYWTNNTRLQIYTNDDYYRTSWDRGHLVPAEDFSYDCELSKSTFDYINCLPQSPKLNRGQWKSIESRLRKKSIAVPMIIVTGGIWLDNYSTQLFIIPSIMWKAVFHEKSKILLELHVFTNDTDAQQISMTITELSAITKINFEQLISQY